MFECTGDSWLNRGAVLSLFEQFVLAIRAAQKLWASSCHRRHSRERALSGKRGIPSLAMREQDIDTQCKNGLFYFTAEGTLVSSFYVCFARITF